MDKTKHYLFLKLVVFLLVLMSLYTRFNQAFFESNEYQIQVEYRQEVSILRSVNLNTADSKELQRLYRVGPVIAERIIAYRKANGKFKTIEEIQEVKGIGPKIFEYNAHLLTV